MTDPSRLSAVIARVQSSARLQTSSNVHEAAAAAAAADRIIQEHGLSEAQVEADSGESGEAAGVAREPLAVFHKRIPAWQLRLIVVLARHYDVGLYVDGYRYLTERAAEEHVRMIGRASDTEAVRFMYSWLHVEIERLTQEAGAAETARLRKLHGPRETVSQAFLTSFRVGAVTGVQYALHDSKQQARKAPGVTSTALAVVDRRMEAVDAVKATMKMDGKKRSRTTVRDETAFIRGSRAGRELHERGSARKLGG